VLCLRFPSFLTTPDARALYPLDLIRLLIHLHLVGGFGLGVLWIVLSRRTTWRCSGARRRRSGRWREARAGLRSSLCAGLLDGTGLYAYLVFVSFHAIFVHANVRFRFGILERIVGTPKFHHWHHATAPVDKNFAIHLPIIDRLFGTYWLPAQFPPAYGIQGQPVPGRYLAQLVWPFQRRA
jgi:hypothetical protein